MAIENKNFGFARHPGKTLARELSARGMTNAELAVRAGTSVKISLKLSMELRPSALRWL